MEDAPVTDLPRLDADVRRAAERLASEAPSLRTKEGRELARRRDPFQGLRHVAGQSTYRALVEREPPPHELLHRDALLRWVVELLQARVGRELAIEDAEREHARSEEGERARRKASSLDASSSTPEGEARETDDTFAFAMRALVRAPDAWRAASSLDRAAALAAPVAAVRRERRMRRAEVARRLGLAHPYALVLPGEAEDPSGAKLARAVLDATEPLAGALHREARKHAAGSLGPLDTVHAALARDVREGWPAKLGERWLEGVFRGLATGRAVRAVRFPEPLGGASFLRAAYAWGHAMREQGTARSLPFALARDPYATGAHRLGAVLALGLADPALQAKALGVSRRTAADQARSLRRTMFVALRTLAARVLLGGDEGVTPDAFEELTLRVFGAPLPVALRDAWPDVRVDDVARLAAAAGAHGSLLDLVSRFDEDWFWNPRAGAHVGSVACGPLAEPLLVTPAAIAALARAAEEALG